MVFYLINFAGNLLEWYINISFFSALHVCKLRKWMAFLLGTILTVFQFVNTSFLLTNTLLVSVGAFIYSLLLSCQYKMKWYWHLLESFFIYVIIAAPEVFYAMVAQLVLKVDLAFLQSDPILFALGTISSKFVSIFIVKYIRIGKIRKSIQASGSVVLPLLLLPIATFLIIITSIKADYLVREKSFMLLTLISTFLLMIANMVIYWIIERQNDFVQTKQALHYAQSHIQSQISHYRELYEYQTEIRKSRHDSQNKLLALSGLLQSGDVELAQELVAKELEDSAAFTTQVVNSGNPVIDAVLQSKQNTAANRNIVLSASIQLEEEIRINELELGVLIGNAVDNAIEATEKVQNNNPPEIFVQLRSLMGRIVISITNPTAEEAGSVSALQSTKLDAKNHGFGLKSIQSIVDKYDGTLSITWQNHQFIMEIGVSNAS